MTTLEFDEWHDAGGNPVMRINAGTLQVWNGSAWQTAGVAPLSSSNVTATTGSPTITTDGSAQIYSFTGSGSITLDQGGTCDILVIGGGGSGGAWWAGGGGAGGVLYAEDAYLPAGTHNVVIGVGGTKYGISGSTTFNRGCPGQTGESSQLGPYYAPGGGGGGGIQPRDATSSRSGQVGQNGGSGGGAGGDDAAYGGAVSGSGISGLGNDAGAPRLEGGGGGGGAGSVGTTSSTNGVGGDGGAGRSISITGSAVTYGGGGGGANGGSGGTGGGGNGSADSNTSGVDGTDGLGGGGGGGGYKTNIWGGEGGTGIVIVRFAS